MVCSIDALYVVYMSQFPPDDEDQQNMWLSICRQCAITCNVGHAFSIVLLHQRVCSDKSFSEEGEMNEEWESVTAERGHWATLHNNLQVLIHLSNIVGLDRLRRLPSIPFAEVSEDEDEKASYVVEPSKLKFFDKGIIFRYVAKKSCILCIAVYRSSCLCAASLKNGGPSLISHCLCEWVVQMDYSPQCLHKLSSHEGGNCDSKPIQLQGSVISIVL